MKTILSFLKATISGGFFVLLPVVLLWLVLTEIVDLAVAMLQPIAELLPVDTIGGVAMTRIVAVLLILSVCLVTGLLMKTRLARAIGGWFETVLLGQIPGSMKSLSSSKTMPAVTLPSLYPSSPCPTSARSAS